MKYLKKIFENNNNMNVLAIYAGSFNPFHKGHLNIAEKAERIFGKGNVLIAIGINPAKNKTEDMSIRANEISKKTGFPVEIYETFLHEFIEKKESDGYKVILVRGLRDGNDLAYEDNQLKYIMDFKKDIDVVFLRCDKEYSHISSSSIRNLQEFRPGSGDKYII
jgi:pantetheine-phosphate adenylyltransferase